MPLSKSKEHRVTKEIVESKLHYWFGASVKEYPSAGHELDVFAVTSSGVSIYVEVIWVYSKTQFLSDMNMLQQSDADVKLVIGSPEVIADTEMLREFAKIVVSQRRTGKIIHGDILNGVRILEDPEYVENDLRRLFLHLTDEAKLSRPSQATLKIVDLRAAKSEWVSGNFYNIIGKVLCEGQRIIRRSNAELHFLQMQTPAKYVSVSNDGKVSELNWKDLDFSWSPDGSDSDNRRGEFPEMRQGDSIFVVFPDAVGSGFSSGGPVHWWKRFFQLTHGSSYKVRMIIDGISGGQTITAEETIEFIV